MDKLHIWHVNMQTIGGGAYVPEDPCVSSGGYYANRVDTFLITASTRALAVQAAKLARPNAKVLWPVKLLGPAHG